VKKQHYWLVVLTILSTLISLLASKEKWGWVESFASNLAAGFLCSFLIVMFIDRALARERDRQSATVRSLAFSALRPVLGGHLLMLWSWYKGATLRMPTPPPTTIHEAFSGSYYHEIAFLDFSRNAPVFPQMDWFTWCAKGFQAFRTDVLRIIDTYAPMIDVETLGILQAVTTSGLVAMIPQLTAIRSIDPQLRASRNYDIFAGEGMEQLVKDHVESVERLLDCLNTNVLNPLKFEELGFLREDVEPILGSSRIDQQSLRSGNLHFSAHEPERPPNPS
jgi:hypothetical protein